MICASLLTFGQATSPRFGTLKNQDNTGRVLTYKYSTPTLADAGDSVAISPNASKTIYNAAALTHAKTVKVGKVNAKVCDELIFIFTSDTLTAGRVVTFSTNFVVSASTLTVDASQKATISFIFDGVAWIETSRAKQ